MIKNISVVIIVKNGASTIKKVLESILNFTDVIVYDNGSTDATKDIVKTFSNVNLIEGEFLGFGPTKNKAASYALNDWIFSLDADEVVSKEFVENLYSKVLDKNTIYTILRSNFYKQTQVKYCWGDDVITRIYNRKSTSFTEKKVHEKVIQNNLKIEQLKGVIKHYPYNSISDFIVKLDRYSTIYAQDNVNKKSSSPLKAILNAKYSFIKTYFFKRGFLDGYVGVIIAFSHMATNFYKYMKLYEINKELKK